MSDKQPDDEGDGLLERWGDIEQPFGDPEDSRLIPETASVDDYADPDIEELTTDLSAVDPDLLNTFTVCVLLANVGVLLVSVGILLAVFRGWLWIGGGLLGVGLLALFRLRQHYRSYTRADDQTVDETETAADTESDDDSDTAADTVAEADDSPE